MFEKVLRFVEKSAVVFSTALFVLSQFQISVVFRILWECTRLIILHDAIGKNSRGIRQIGGGANTTPTT